MSMRPEIKELYQQKWQEKTNSTEQKDIDELIAVLKNIAHNLYYLANTERGEWIE